VQSYRAVKTVDQTKVTPGEKVTYTITLTNTGQVDYSAAHPASYTDDLSSVLDDATYNNDATNGATYAEPELSWSGPLLVGHSVTVKYSVTVKTPDHGDQKLKNTVVTTGPGGNCPADSTNPDCTANVPGNQLQVTKTASVHTAHPGQRVTYTITVKNTGQTGFTASDPATLTDDLSGVLDDATYNGDATDGTTVTGHALHWSGPLAIGATAVIKYSITVDKPDTGDKLLKNVVQLPPDENSNCSSDSTDPACRTVTPVAQYDVVKKASSAQVKEGARVTYTITVTNTGQAGYPAAHPATLRDDLSGVLDDATYDHDATSEPTGTVTYTAPVLSWAGALPIGATIKVTYTVTVDKPDHGNGKLDNVVTTPEAPNGVDVANCSPNSTDPSCSTETGVSSTSSPPASTGNDTQLQLILAALLLASGGVFLALGLRRRRMNR
jgi:uncharacterized repeat protein (TIGR01451 family)